MSDRNHFVNPHTYIYRCLPDPWADHPDQESGTLSELGESSGTLEESGTLRDAPSPRLPVSPSPRLPDEANFPHLIRHPDEVPDTLEALARSEAAPLPPTREHPTREKTEKVYRFDAEARRGARVYIQHWVKVEEWERGRRRVCKTLYIPRHLLEKVTEEIDAGAGLEDLLKILKRR